MTITPNDKKQLIENYCNYIIDGLDMDSLVQIAYDLLEREYEKYSWDEIQGEIVDLYDEETLIELLPEGNNKWDSHSLLSLSSSVQWLAPPLFKRSTNYKMTNYPDSANNSPMVHPTMKCVRTSDDIIRRYSSVESDGDWDDILSPDDYEEYIERRQYERSMRY